MAFIKIAGIEREFASERYMQHQLSSLDAQDAASATSSTLSFISRGFDSSVTSPALLSYVALETSWADRRPLGVQANSPARAGIGCSTDLWTGSMRKDALRCP